MNSDYSVNQTTAYVLESTPTMQVIRPRDRLENLLRMRLSLSHQSMFFFQCFLRLPRLLPHPDTMLKYSSHRWINESSCWRLLKISIVIGEGGETSDLHCRSYLISRSLQESSLQTSYKMLINYMYIQIQRSSVFPGLMLRTPYSTLFLLQRYRHLISVLHHL